LQEPGRCSDQAEDVVHHQQGSAEASIRPGRRKGDPGDRPRRVGVVECSGHLQANGPRLGSRRRTLLQERRLNYSPAVSFTVYHHHLPSPKLTDFKNGLTGLDMLSY